ncbi:MAG: Ribbon-helix-helix protein, copG family [Promethearchaeota archaeon]|nr:MAG: Ribbon-helix-helix protein, copG family [Candidatus Lokiarchaeota archaeon]
MKICTINIPESYIDAIDELTGEGGLYPSRSELIRCAVRQFLLKELERAKKMEKYEKFEETLEYDSRKYVKIPIDKDDKDNDEPVREFRTYKIIRKLS